MAISRSLGGEKVFLKAFALVHSTSNQQDRLLQLLSETPGVKAVDETTGEFNLVVFLEAPGLLSLYALKTWISSLPQVADCRIEVVLL